MILFAIVAVPIVLASPILLFSCIQIRKIIKSRKSRCKAKKDEESGKTDNASATPVGIVNDACEDITNNETSTSTEQYETCQEVDSQFYDYATVPRPEDGRWNSLPDPYFSSDDPNMYAVLEGPSSETAVTTENGGTSEEAGTLNPMYFNKIDKSFSNKTRNGEQVSRSGGSKENEGHIGVDEVCAITPEPLYFTLETGQGGDSGDIGELRFHLGYEKYKEGTVDDIEEHESGYGDHDDEIENGPRMIRGASKDSAGYMDDGRVSEDNMYDSAIDYFTELYDEIPHDYKTTRDSKDSGQYTDEGGICEDNCNIYDNVDDDVGYDVDEDTTNPHEEIYENWNDEILTRNVSTSNKYEEDSEEIDV